MPAPIKPIRDNENDKGYNGMIMDYSFLANLQQSENKKVVIASNSEADAIVKIWTSGEKTGENKYNIANSNISKSDIIKLKSKGLIEGDDNNVAFTNRGRTVITTMALGENNAFLKGQNKKSYKEILASMDKKGKSGYRVPKFSSDTSNGLDITDI